MQLYTYLSNKKGTSKSLGCNSKIDIELTIEKEKGAWQRGRVGKVFIFLRLKNGNPYLHIEVPKDWKQAKTSISNVLRLEPANQIKD